MNIPADDKMHNEIWKRAWRLRCCPPSTLLFSARCSEELHAHLRFCPWCKAERHEESALIDPILFPREDVTGMPQLGEIRAVRHALAGWGEKFRYHNPPTVLVVAVHEGGTVTVVQLHDVHELSGDGDILLTPGHHVFAESWNRYSLAHSDLAQPLGQASPYILEKIAAATSAPAAELAEGSLLWFFRNLEVEVGYFFARRSIAAILEQKEINLEQVIQPAAPWSDTLAYGNLTEFLDSLRSLGLGLDQKQSTTSSPGEALLALHIPDDRLPLAAADSETTYALLLTCRGGKIVSWAPCALNVNDHHFEGKALHITGYFRDTSDDCSILACWWQSKGGNFPAVPGQAGVKEGVFWASFTVPAAHPDILSGRLALYLLQVE
jgi:hypothetical protein